MTDLRERFRELDSLDAPEVWPAVVRRGPRPPMDLGPSPRRRAGIAFLALIIGIGGLAFAAQAFRTGSRQPVAPTSTVSNGKIAFARYSDGRWQIATINPDGTLDATLTDIPGEAFHPAWSPDGHRILFDVQSSGGRMQIFVVNEDGTGLTQLTDDPGWNYLPAWSSDGAKIAFVSSRDGNDEIYVMNANGLAQTRLTDSPNEDLSPSWAPGGDRIVFQSNRDGNNEIYVMNPDGTGVTRLTDDPGAFDGAPKWSPAGDRIVFASDRDGPGLYTMSTGGTDIVQLTHDRQVGPLDPAWSPDGASIVYTTSVEGTNQAGLFVVDVDARSRQAIPDAVGGLCCPSWQPIIGDPTQASSSGPPSPSDATPAGLVLAEGTARGTLWSLIATGGGQPDGLELRWDDRESGARVVAIQAGESLRVGWHTFARFEPDDAVVFGAVPAGAVTVKHVPGYGLPHTVVDVIDVPGAEWRAFVLASYAAIGVVTARDSSGASLGEFLIVPPGCEPMLHTAEAFLGARQAGQGAETFLTPEALKSFGHEGMSALYAGDQGGTYVSSDVLFIDGPYDVAAGGCEVGVRLEASDGTVAEETLALRPDDAAGSPIVGASSGITGP